MALHEIPDDGTKHEPSSSCPCRPKAGKRSDRGVIRTVYAHHEQEAPAPLQLSDRISVPAGEADYVAPPADPEVGPEAECGHVVVRVDGEWQHHAIPGDDAPHSASAECGCGPQRHDVDGHIVYEHVDQAAGEDYDEQDYDEGV